MDRELPLEIRRRRVAKRAIVAFIAVAAVVFTFGATIQWLRPSVRLSDLQTARVERGTVDATLQASGTIVPATEQVVSSPVEARVLRLLHRAGDQVRPGDELLALDNLSSRLDLERADEKLAQKQNDVVRLRLLSEESVSDLRAELEQKKLDAQILHLRATQSRRLREEGLSSEQDALVDETAAKKIDIEIAQLQEKIVRTARNGQSQLAAAAFETTILQKDREQSRRELELSMMRAGRAGVITWITPEEGATVRKGDVLARIADLSSYRVDAAISDVHASAIAAGMPVRVRVDDATFGGSITSVEPRIDAGVVKFHVRLDDPSNARLRNNARVDVYPVTGRREGTLRVRRGALGAGQMEDVFVVRDGALERRTVRWGLAGQETIEPLSGLSAGDEVVISNMSEYAGVKTLRLK